MQGAPLTPVKRASEPGDALSTGERLLVVTLHGIATPNLVSSFMAVLAEAGQWVELCDISSFTVEDRFTMTLAVRIKGAGAEVHDGSSSARFNGPVVDASEATPAVRRRAEHHRGIEGYLLRELLLTAHELGGIEIDFEVLDGAESSVSASIADTELDGRAYTFTFLGTPRIPAAFFAAAARLFAESSININSIQRLSEPGGSAMCLQISANVAAPLGSAVRRQLLQLGKQHLVDIAFERSGSLRTKRMVVFDLSWTLLQADACEVLIAAAGADSATLADLRRRHASDADALLRARAQLLRGHSVADIVRRTRSLVEYTHGARSVCQVLKRLGYRLAVLSSGPALMAEIAKEDLGLDFAVGNRLAVDASGAFTGEILEPLVNGDRKGELLVMLCMQEHLDREQVIAVGDGPVSARMLELAGLSIAFEQPEARDAADTDGKIQSKSLASILFLLGISERDMRSFTGG
ncbi:hypothetical protein CDCA_CDCA05G1676 [Cyanidium caldarium]|uniref:Phosphoserine phosphatase ACT domain-containing protein n=1 Tax=Cyanidium caldarium TaxID=2771 RepID=A0AAV9IU64_CYACA|nr:hypothetical protein CDCA_CDCA05G1676 [Cyanidium caldarium]|eukprot:ctg_502.g254